jgi:hypothetical protein
LAWKINQLIGSALLETIYVPFQKKTQKTTKQDLQIGQQRYQEMMAYRESQLPEDNDRE